jgi:hypothetical protein
MVEPEHVECNAFATIVGTFVCYIMQQGDCNAPATFQHLMMHVFRSMIGYTIHVYLDDIFIYTNTIKEHEVTLGKVFNLL